MNITERREIYYWAMSPEAPLCANCKHFHLHYIKDGIPVSYTHLDVYKRQQLL